MCEPLDPDPLNVFDLLEERTTTSFSDEEESARIQRKGRKERYEGEGRATNRDCQE